MGLPTPAPTSSLGRRPRVWPAYGGASDTPIAMSNAYANAGVIASWSPRAGRGRLLDTVLPFIPVASLHIGRHNMGCNDVEGWGGKSLPLFENLEQYIDELEDPRYWPARYGLLADFLDGMLEAVTPSHCLRRPAVPLSALPRKRRRRNAANRNRQ